MVTNFTVNAGRLYFTHGKDVSDDFNVWYKNVKKDRRTHLKSDDFNVWYKNGK